MNRIFGIVVGKLKMRFRHWVGLGYLKPFLTFHHFRWAGAFIFLGGLAMGQTISPQPVSSSPVTTLPASPQDQQSLLQSYQALVAQGATAEQLQAWQQQNASGLAALHAAQAAKMTAPMPILPNSAIPDQTATATEQLRYLQIKLQNNLAQIHNQLVAAQGNSPLTPSAQAALHQQEAATFLQQNAADLQTIRALGQTVLQQEAQTPLTLPPLQIPADVTPAMRAFLTLRDQVMREELQVENQNRSATPEAHAAAIRQWEQQNAAELAKLAQLAKNLSANGN